MIWSRLLDLAWWALAGGRWRYTVFYSAWLVRSVLWLCLPLAAPHGSDIRHALIFDAAALALYLGRIPLGYTAMFVVEAVQTFAVLLTANPYLILSQIAVLATIMMLPARQRRRYFFIRYRRTGWQWNRATRDAIPLPVREWDPAWHSPLTVCRTMPTPSTSPAVLARLKRKSRDGCNAGRPPGDVLGGGDTRLPGVATAVGQTTKSRSARVLEGEDRAERLSVSALLRTVTAV